jgi:hypothetical protein
VNGITAIATVRSAIHSDMMKHHQLEPLFLISGLVKIVTKIVRLKIIVRRMMMPITEARKTFLKKFKGL